MFEVTNDNINCIRKTADDPPKVSVYDVIAIITKQAPKNAIRSWLDMKNVYPEVTNNLSHFKFKGQGQRETPVADAREIVSVVLLFVILPRLVQEK